MVQEFRGSDWFGQVYFNGSSFCFTVAFCEDGEHILFNHTAGYSSSLSARRGLDAFLELMAETRADVLAELVAAGVPLKDHVLV